MLVGILQPAGTCGACDLKYLPVRATKVGYPAICDQWHNIAGTVVEPYDATMLEDGTYDAIVVDADDGPSGDAVVVELAVASGPDRGLVITISATGLGRTAIDLLALPATITVVDGRPTVELDD